MSAGERHFWYVMLYRCNGCGLTMEFYLEDGCEGPKDRLVPLPEWAKPHRAMAPPEVQRRLSPTVPQTKGGRYVLPVPFIAAGCPTCQGDPPWCPTSGVLCHADWSRDREVDTTDPPAYAGRFFYPDDPTERGACGRPVLPGKIGGAT